jgi:hypothetical protein
MNTNYVKAAIIGTQDYHGVMRCAAEVALFRGAGYTAQVTQDTTIELNPVGTFFERLAEKLFQGLTTKHKTPYKKGIITIIDYGGGSPAKAPYIASPRMPYLLIAWILVGADNPYRCNQYFDDDAILWHIARLFVVLALGYNKCGALTQADLNEIENHILNLQSDNHAALLAYDTAIYAARILYHCLNREGLIAAESIIPKAASAAYYAFGQGHGDAAESAIKKQIQKWQHIPDEAVVSFAHEVVMHSLAAKKTNPDLE